MKNYPNIILIFHVLYFFKQTCKTQTQTPINKTKHVLQKKTKIHVCASIVARCYGYLLFVAMDIFLTTIAKSVWSMWYANVWRLYFASCGYVLLYGYLNCFLDTKRVVLHWTFFSLITCGLLWNDHLKAWPFESLTSWKLDPLKAWPFESLTIKIDNGLTINVSEQQHVDYSFIVVKLYMLVVVMLLCY